MNKSGNTDEEKRWQRWQLDGGGGDSKNVLLLEGAEGSISPNA